MQRLQSVWFCGLHLQNLTNFYHQNAVRIFPAHFSDLAKWLLKPIFGLEIIMLIPKLSNSIPIFRLKRLKIIPFEFAHTYLAYIDLYSPPNS